MIKNILIQCSENKDGNVDEKSIFKNLVNSFTELVTKSNDIRKMLDDYEIQYVETFPNDKALLDNTTNIFELTEKLLARTFSRHQYPSYHTEFEIINIGSILNVILVITEEADLYNGLKAEVSENLENDEDYEGDSNIDHITRELYDTVFPSFYEGIADDFSNLVDEIKREYLLKENK